MYSIEFKKFENTDKFRQAAIHFQLHNYYTAAPKGTTAFKEYWDEERSRSLYGYTALDGEYITGYNYFYLNYCQILLIQDKKVFNPKLKELQKKQVRTRNFPSFYDYDKYFFDVIEECERVGKHLAVLKSRRKGYSFKVAAMLCRNYFLIPDSKGFALASNSEYLVRDGLLSKTWEVMAFIDENTAWSKKRQKTDSKMHKRASIVVDKGDGVKIELGYKSEIIGVSLGNDPQASRGKAGKLIVFEEAGSFPHLKTAWQVAQPSVEQGSTVHGLMIAFGTGGTEHADFEGLKDIFYEPNGYNCLEIKNVWSEGATKPSGFYVPYTAHLEGEFEGKTFIDDQGNSLFRECKEYVLSKRQEVISSASDRTIIDKYIAERSLTPEEAALNISTNIFPKEELLRHLAHIRNSEKLKEFKQVGDLIFGVNGNVDWVPTTTPKDHTTYKLPNDGNKHGQIVIWEHPISDAPWGLYVGSCDPYDHDKSTTDSLLSCFIYKRTTPGYGQGDIIVAEYTGRPNTAEEAYEIVRLLAIYYHCNILYENQCKGMFPYFTHKHSDYLLADQPDIIKDIIKNSNVQRSKGTHMSKEIKIWAEGRTKEWLNTELSPGIKRLTTIYSEPLIEELISYNDEGNFDRVISFFLLMIYLEELYHLQVKKRNIEPNDRLLFREPLFEIPPFNF
jgi:hypothetical protein